MDNFLKITDVKKVFNEGKLLEVVGLNNINIELQKGELVVI